MKGESDMRKKSLLKLFAILVALSLTSSISFTAAASDVSIMASDYLVYYRPDCYADPGGEIEVWFDVNATREMDYVGASHIIIQVLNNGSLSGVQTYFGTTANGMLRANASHHVGYITYQGVPGKTYRAMVIFYAANSSGSDFRMVYTNTVVAY